MGTNRATTVNANQEHDQPEPDGPPGTGMVTAFLVQSKALRRIVAGMGFAPADADDILQDVYIEAARAGSGCQDPDQAARWLARVTVNRCLLEYRRRQRFTRAAGQILEDRAAISPKPPLPDELAARAEQLDAVRRAMQDLDESLLAPLALRYFSDMNATEISQIMDLPASTVRSRLREARLILARELADRGLEP